MGWVWEGSRRELEGVSLYFHMASVIHSLFRLQRRVFVYGEKLIDRIDFEELSLKSLDPSLGPRIGQLRTDNPEKDTTLIQAIKPHSNPFSMS